MNKKGWAAIFILALAVIIGIYFFINKSLTSAVPNPASNLSFPISPDAPAPAPTPVPVYNLDNLNPSPAPAPEPLPLPTPTPTPVGPMTHSIDIVSFNFNKPALTIKKGDTAVWTNKDSSVHTVTGNDGVLGSPILQESEQYSYTFDSVGTYYYRCVYHSSMTGVVTVTE
ncbi:MAG TPA: plastocyanin/azurin family copper-binding protein [Candidatus Paceibacterota bacterium]